MPTSNITNTILDPSAVAVEGVLVRATLMPGPGFREDTGTEVARSVSTESAANGSWTLALERNTNIAPENTYYVVDEFIPQQRGGPTRYIIQVGAANASVQASMVNPNPTLDPTLYLTQAAGDVRYAAALGFGDTPDTITPDQAAAQGSSGNAARGDHSHGISTAVPVALGTSLSEGTGDDFARATHVHTPLARTGWTVTRVAAQSITGGATGADISWDTEVQDTPGNFTAPSTTLTIPTGGDGLWAVTFQLTASAEMANYFRMRITAGGNAYTTIDSDDIGAIGELTQTIVVPLAATNTIVCRAVCGETRTVTGRLTAYRMGI